MTEFWKLWFQRKRGNSRIRTGLWVVTFALAALVLMMWISVDAMQVTTTVIEDGVTKSETKTNVEGVTALMGVVVAPVVSIAAAYFGMSIARSGDDNGRSSGSNTEGDKKGKKGGEDGGDD
ncbi:hypothetical protein MYK68_04530 [Gordonia sp. PP30]|uniref:hypothetical protein n=1 Tax=unclassified Gordonia (in: high G+C Gram-positive bacteria) TaxID=2657482 RepID=UPI001FFF443C|nr:hypothetical protein [Gordonia sp. PP30]UQE75878.1 hypothetical protein MYK68_04530 [Gordonia sp. PP30]